MSFEACDASFAPAATDGRQAEYMLQEVYSSGDGQNYRQEQIQAIHSVTSDVNLPGIHLFDSDNQHDGIISGALRIGADLLQGAAEEVVHHPDRLLTNLAVGAAVGAIAVIASPAVLLAGAAVGVAAGAAYVGVEMANGNNPFEGVGDFIEDCSVVANPDGHSAFEVSRAHETVQAGGGVMLEVAAGAAAGVGGAALTTAARAGSMAALETAVVSDVLEAPAQRLLLTGPSSEVAAAQTAERTVVQNVGSAGGDVIEGTIVRAASGADDAVVQAARTYDGQIGTSASPGFNPSQRLTGDALLARLEQEKVLSGYPHDWQQFAVRNLRNPEEIREFVRAAQSRDFANSPEELLAYLDRKVFMGNRVPAGTEDVWEAELARLRTVVTERGLDPRAYSSGARLERVMAAEPRTSAMAGQGGRHNPATGEDLIALLQREAEGTEFRLDWGNYAVRNLRDHQEIQDFVEAVARRHVGREEELFAVLRNQLESPTGGTWADGTRQAWVLALRSLNPKANLI